MRTKVFNLIQTLPGSARKHTSDYRAAKVTLTPEQQELLLKINDTVGDSDTRVYRYIKQKMVDGALVRETTTAMALERKGLVDLNRAQGTVRPTLEGYWLWDALKVEARLMGAI